MAYPGGSGRVAKIFVHTILPGQLSLLSSAAREVSRGDVLRLGSKDRRGSFHSWTSMLDGSQMIRR